MPHHTAQTVSIGYDPAPWIAALIADRGRITRADLNRIMTDAYGGSDANGLWTQRDSFEALERALALHLLRHPRSLTAPADIRHAIGLAANMPTQTVRSEEQLNLQQFSTPIDIAALAVLLAAIGADDVVLEPSAGNGLLVAQIPAHASLQLNELHAGRRDGLVASFPTAIVTGHDAAELVAHHAALERPSVVLMNPPFARSVGRGADDLAAARHLQAALRRVRAGGRVVAIMPDWFAPSARLQQVFAAVLAGCSVRTSLRLTGCYAKHGTSIDVRLYVIDKADGAETCPTIERGSVADLLDALTVPDRLPLAPILAPSPTPALALFGAARATKVAPPRSFRAPARNAVLPVGYTTLTDPAPLGDQVGIYLPYRPSRLVFDTAGEHPSALVESIAMGSIPSPIASHIPHLPERTVTDRLLSAAQLETVVYAGHAWSQMLSGRFRPDKQGVGLVLDEDGREYRKGFFLGDGTGAGKGRQGGVT